MSKRFWFWLRIIGWIILMIWYIVYAAGSVFPLFKSPLMEIVQSIIGIVATLLILIGYYELEKRIGGSKK